MLTFTLFWVALLKRLVSPLTLLRTAFVFVSSFSSSLRLALKNCFILCICCCIRQQPQDAGSVRHTEHTRAHKEIHQVTNERKTHRRCSMSWLNQKNSLTIFCAGSDVTFGAISVPGELVSLAEHYFQQTQENYG